ncbi:DNA-binding protein [Cupriavidus sp. D39]|uniref:DNA-binding protein n=1 Tax=Cupriavidus sp. D39 TaxID=2997877 RepID=UPI003B6357C3
MTASPLDHPPPTPGDAAPEARLAADVAALRAQFPETRALYREVCALLFFRYGITPTANKLYGLVRKGSMGTPTEVLAQFWQDLRGKMRVTIDQPGLPDALKAIAANAVQSIWQAANEAATGELAALRAEARWQASEAEAQRDQARAAVVVAEQETKAVQAEFDAAQQARAALQGSWTPSARPTRPHRRVTTRASVRPRRSSGSCRSCVPNSRRSWSAPASRWPSRRSGPAPPSAARCARSTRSARCARRASSP